MFHGKQFTLPHRRAERKMGDRRNSNPPRPKPRIGTVRASSRGMVPDAAPTVHDAAVPVRYDYLDALRGLGHPGRRDRCTPQNQHEAPWLGWRLALAGRYGVQLFLHGQRVHDLPDARPRAVARLADLHRVLHPPCFSASCPCSGSAWRSTRSCRGGRRSLRTITFAPLDYALTALLQHGWRPALINSLVPGGWSIAAEGTFYLLAPFCFRFDPKSWPAALWLLLGSLGAERSGSN